MPPDDFLPPNLKRAQRLAWWLDNAIALPIVKKRIGLDPLISALPWGGDLVMLVISLYPLWVAHELALPRSLLVRMGINLLFDYAIGLIPLLGDIADFGWKANARNVALLEEAYRRQVDPPGVIEVEAVEVKPG